MTKEDDDGTCKTCMHKTCPQRTTSSNAYTVCHDRPYPRQSQSAPLEQVRIPKELLADIKVYLRCGSDGTLSNSTELLHAIETYSHPIEIIHCNHAMNVIECECWKWCAKTETCPHLNEAGKAEARKFQKNDPAKIVFFFGVPLTISPELISKAVQLEKAVRDHDVAISNRLLTKILGISKPNFDYSLEESGWNCLMDKIADMKRKLDAGETI